MTSESRIVVGLISDTHGLVRPEVFEALAGVSRILHAGDVGPPEILVELAAIAPVSAVYGNTDAPGRADLSELIETTIGGVRIVVTHGHELGVPTPAKLVTMHPNADVIVYGHTHQQLISNEEGRVVVNPGSAGQRRFQLQPSVAKLYIEHGHALVEIVPLA